jgi:hypothetical protein
VSRNKAQKAVAKKLLRNPAGEFRQLSPDDPGAPVWPEWMTRAFANNRYAVMINDNDSGVRGMRVTRVMVQRHDDKPLSNHWREMQDIKNQLFSKETIAVEFYPAESQVVDQANIYWFWIFPRGEFPVPAMG